MKKPEDSLTTNYGQEANSKNSEEEPQEKEAFKYQINYTKYTDHGIKDMTKTKYILT